ncbi:sulfotransferase family protein [Mycobacterium sp. NPDC051804]|uniref:sulfotransferase family protein n=1 Tax=Mycobacterium sp. NPDC051804 TaxID=3364295 RepID=UPI0037BA6B13
MDYLRTTKPSESAAATDVLEDFSSSRAESRRVVLFVLGVGRSGSSALTRVLSLSGGTLPAGMRRADWNNPRGYWEPRETLSLNETILRQQGSAGFDFSLRLLEDNGFDADEKAACIAKMGTFLNGLPDAPIVVIKDSYITNLSDMWFEAARLSGLDVAAVIPVRDPHEVIASQAAAGPMSPELTSAVWLKYSLLAERGTRGLPRVFVSYANLLHDWRRELRRISTTLAVDLHPRDEQAIEEFLTPDLWHQRHCGPVKERFGADWISAVYEAMLAAARDEPWDESVLDRVFEEYRVAEHDFRVASENYRALVSMGVDRVYSNRVPFRPTIKKLVYQVVAKARGRRALGPTFDRGRNEVDEAR